MNALNPQYLADEWTPTTRVNTIPGWQPGWQLYDYNPSADVSGNGEVYTINPERQQWLQQSGYKPVRWTGPDGQPAWGISDAQGNIIPESAATGFNDRAFWNAALLAGAVTGANMGAAGFGANGLEGAATEAGAASGSSAGLSSADKAAMFGDAGYGAGMTGAETAAYGGSGAGTMAGTKTAGGGGTSLADFFSGNGSASDYGRLAQTLYGMYAQNKATDAAAGGQAAANALMRDMWQASQAENKPLVDMRNNTILPKLNALLSNPSSITQDPGYQFGLDEMRRQRENAFAGRGGYYSGAQLRRADRDAIDYSGTKLNESINRLIAPANLTQIGSNNNQQANNALAGGLGNGLAQMGNIRGSGFMGQANTVNNAMNNWFADNWFKQGGG